MRTLKQHLDSVKYAMSAAYAGSAESAIINATNVSANTIAGLSPIGQLMDQITINPGDRLPSNLAGITVVRDASSGDRMWERGSGAVGSDEEIGRYYIDIDHAPFSKIGFPFKSTGSITAGTSRLTCPDMISLATGAFLYVRQVGSTVYQAKLDNEGKVVLDNDENVILLPIPSSAFNPQLPGVRFYDSGETNNGYSVYYGENEELAYWNHATHGWIVSALEEVGTEPTGYFDIDVEAGEGVGEGEYTNLFMTLDIIEESDVETIADDDFTDLIICITNATYGDYYYDIISVNEDNTFNLSGGHPFTETDSIVTIYKEATSRIRFVDFSESEITSGTYDVFYWKYPNPLTQNDEIIPFIYPEYLELMTIRRLPETKDRRPVSKTELEKAEAISKKKEPQQHPPSRPMTAQGSPFSMGSSADAYTVRGE